MFEEEEPGKPKNWTRTTATIIVVLIINITVIVVCRILLDSEDEFDEPLIKGSTRDNLTYFLGIFSMTFGFFCCGCFGCGGGLCRSIRWLLCTQCQLLDVSKIWSGAIKTKAQPEETIKTIRRSSRQNAEVDDSRLSNSSNDSDELYQIELQSYAFDNSGYLDHKESKSNSEKQTVITIEEDSK